MISVRDVASRWLRAVFIPPVSHIDIYASPRTDVLCWLVVQYSFLSKTKCYPKNLDSCIMVGEITSASIAGELEASRLRNYIFLARR